MLLVLSVICVSVICLLIGIRIKRTTDEREMERHSITAEALHSLLDSNQEILLFDVRQPLDLLANSEIIPRAKRIPPRDVLQNPSLIPKEKTRLFTALAPAIKPVERSCRELALCVSCASSFSKADWRPGRRKAIRSKHTTRPSTSDNSPRLNITPLNFILLKSIGSLQVSCRWSGSR